MTHIRPYKGVFTNDVSIFFLYDKLFSLTSAYLLVAVDTKKLSVVKVGK